RGGLRRLSFPHALPRGRAGRPFAGECAGPPLYDSRALAPIPDARLLEDPASALRRQDLFQLPDPVGPPAANVAPWFPSVRLSSPRRSLSRSEPLHARETPRGGDRPSDGAPPELRSGRERPRSSSRVPALLLCRP